MEQVNIAREQLRLLRLAAANHIQHCRDCAKEADECGMTKIADDWRRDEEQFKSVLEETNWV